jgi:radical SAM enzyme (rSAM/lipoprotein system)
MSVSKIGFRKNMALKLFSAFKKNETKVHQLNYMLWECTLRCNLNCRHCGSDCKKDARQNDMPARDFLRALDELGPLVNPNKTTIVLTGGEALLRNDLENIGRQLYQRGFPWGMVTNGMLLTQERLQSMLDSGLRTITISLDGLEQSHNWLRGNPKGYENALAAIKRVVQVPDLVYDVVTCVNQHNLSELNALKTLLIDIGVKAWRLFTIFPIGRAAQEKELQLNPKEFKSLFEFIKQTRSEGRIDLSYGCEGFLGSYEGKVRDNFFFCRAGVNIASVLADGSISACPNLRENFIQGNIYKDNFADVWQNRYQIFRDRSWTKTGACASCEFYSYCEGNGMHLRNEQTGELLFCHLHRIMEGEQHTGLV